MSACDCSNLTSDGRRFWCPEHRMWKTAHWVELCRTRPEYRAAWDAGTGPGQAKGAAAAGELPAYLACPHRTGYVSDVLARDFGCGCGSIALHRCEKFGLVAIKLKTETCQKMAAALPDFSGQTCATCGVPRGDPHG